MKPFLVMFGIVSVTLYGDYLIKLASMKPSGLTSGVFLAGALMYMLSAIGILIAMQHMSLASVGVFYSVLTILMMTGLGVLVFGESLSSRELMGIGFAFAALVCMGRFA